MFCKNIIQSNLYIADMLYSGHLFITDNFSGTGRITVKTLQNNLYITDTYIADTVHNGHFFPHQMTILPVYSGHKIGFEQKLNKIWFFFLKRRSIIIPPWYYIRKTKPFLLHTFIHQNIYNISFFLLDSLPRKQFSFIAEKNSAGKIFQMICIMYLYVSIWHKCFTGQNLFNYCLWIPYNMFLT